MNVCSTSSVNSSPSLLSFLHSTNSYPSFGTAFISTFESFVAEKPYPAFCNAFVPWSVFKDILPPLLGYNPDLIIFISPNPNTNTPSILRQKLANLDIPTVVIGDKPGKKAINKMKEQEVGYIIIEADPMIGARREFLDPTEMALFNADSILFSRSEKLLFILKVCLVIVHH